MKKTFFIAVLFSQFLSFGQDVIPFIDYNRWLRTVEDGQFKHIELQEVKEFNGGDHLVAYLDIRGNLRVYDGKERHDISNMNLKYKVSDKLLAWNVGTTIGVFDQGVKKTLSFFGGDYIVKDDLIVFTDTRYNSVQVYWNGREYPIQISTQDVFITDNEKIGENILAYADNGGLYKIFYKGNFYEVGVWNGKIDLKSGTDIVAFNDPNSRTFAVFEKGQFLDVEMQWVKNYKAGRGFVVYEDVNGNLKKYQAGKITDLSNFPGMWDVVDDVIWFENNGFSYVHYNDKSIQAANFKATEFLLKNGTAVFRNMMGGITAVVKGEIVELSNMPNSQFEIYGNSVLVKLANYDYVIYNNGKILRP